jgi:Peptidase A4 family
MDTIRRRHRCSAKSPGGRVVRHVAVCQPVTMAGEARSSTHQRLLGGGAVGPADLTWSKRILSVIVIAGSMILSLVIVAVPASAHVVRSRAWAGYEATHDTFRHVSARWTVSALTCPGTGNQENADSALWAGLGPTAASSERVGVREFCTGTLATYVGFLEMNGEYEVQAIDPAPGDRIHAAVSFASGKYRFSLSDRTQGESFHHRYRCGAFSQGSGTCSRTTADVLAGIFGPHLSSLADYGKTTFHAVSITDAKGHRGSFAKNGHWKRSRLDEYHRTRLAATASSLSRHGTRFTDAWHHA